MDLYYRPIMECIEALLGNVDFAKDLIFGPERHYSDEDCTIRLYHDLHTGKWWWDTQVYSILSIHSDISYINIGYSNRQPFIMPTKRMVPLFQSSYPLIKLS